MVCPSEKIMKKRSGDQLSRKILSVRPDIPIILCTGYHEQMTKEKALKMGIKGYAHKPVVLKEMSQILRNVLDES